jgi:hypothetical protein
LGCDRGEQSPFANVAESEHIVELIIRYWNNVNDTLINALMSRATDPREELTAE